jgi:hypothetical protein
MATLVVVLFMTGCGSDHPSERSTNPPSGATPPAALQVDFPQTPFNTVTGKSPKYQATQGLSATPQQSVTSQRYVMTVSIF